MYAPTLVTTRFSEAMDDDFNTPIAVAELQSLAELNTAKSSGQGELAAARAAELRALGARLGLLQIEPETFLRKQPLKSPASVVRLVAARHLQPARAPH